MNSRSRRGAGHGIGNLVKDIPDYLMSLALRESLGKELSIALDIFLADYVLKTSYYKGYLLAKNEAQMPVSQKYSQPGRYELKVNGVQVERGSYDERSRLLLGLATFPYQMDNQPNLVALLLRDYIKYAKIKTRKAGEVMEAVNAIRSRVIERGISDDSEEATLYPGSP